MNISEFDTIQCIHRSNGEKHVGMECITNSEIHNKMSPYLLKKFGEFMNGQTMAVIGKEAAYYIGDVKRFLEGKPVID